MRVRQSRLLPTILAAVLLLQSLQGLFFAEFEATGDMKAAKSDAPPPSFAYSGDGSVTTPYQIDSPDQLAELAALVNSGDNLYSQPGIHYQLTAPLDLSDNGDWTPIGKGSKTPFAGHFDGGGNVIKGLQVEQSSYGGLFGVVSGGSLKNITLQGSDVRGGAATGSVAGYVQGSLENCHVTGENSAVAGNEKSETTGGLVGWLVGSADRCSSSANVTGGRNTGGLVGRIEKGKLTDCRSDGDASSRSDTVGGLVGYAIQSELVSCESSGETTGHNYVGGLLGRGEDCPIRAGRVKGSVKGLDYVGGLVGDASGSIRESTADTAVEGVSFCGGAAGRFSGTVTSSTAKGFSVTGTGEGIGGFAGVLEGDAAGSGSVSHISGRDTVGGFVGEHRGGSLSGCYAEGDVTAVKNTAGGLVGWLDGAVVSHSHATGTVKGGQYIGGIGAKITSGGQVSVCYSSGRISGTDYVGGIAGWVQNGGAVKNCYSTSPVTGSRDYIGGIAGALEGLVSHTYSSAAVAGNKSVGGVAGMVRNGTIENCAALGASVLAAENAGRIVGNLGENAVLSQNYAAERLYAAGNAPFTGTDLDGETIADWNSEVWETVFGSENSQWVLRTGNLPSLAPQTQTAPFGQETEEKAEQSEALLWIDTTKMAELVKTSGTDAELVQHGSEVPVGVRKEAWSAIQPGQAFRNDTYGSPVQVRVIIMNPALVSQDMYVSGVTNGEVVEQVAAFFQEYYSNVIQVISLDQKTDWNMPVRIGARVDLSKLDISALHFYSYDVVANVCREIVSPKVNVSGEFLYFTTEYAGEIIVSTGPLVEIRTAEPSPSVSTDNSDASQEDVTIVDEPVALSQQPEKNSLHPVAPLLHNPGTGGAPFSPDSPAYILRQRFVDYDHSIDSISRTVVTLIALFLLFLFAWAVIPRKTDQLCPPPHNKKHYRHIAF